VILFSKNSVLFNATGNDSCTEGRKNVDHPGLDHYIRDEWCKLLIALLIIIIIIIIIM
jgi:hypothetical protein